VESVSSKVEDGNIMPSIGKSGGSSCCPNVTLPLPISIQNCHLIQSFHITLGYSPEPHILLFRRPLGTDPQSGRVDPELERKAREEYRAQYGNRK
jgi:hypothetical protein